MTEQYSYLNYFQREVNLCFGRTNWASLPRRSGKTHGILAPFMHKAQKSMPCGSGIFTGNSFKQIYGRTMPAVFMSWRSMWGLVEGENFVVGPVPKKLNYPEPIYKPLKGNWTNTISFANGFLWQCISLSVPFSANGITTSVIAGDEGKTLSKTKLDQEVMPCLSGVIDPMGNSFHSLINPYYKSSCFVSDASLSKKGNWLEQGDKRMDAVVETGPNKGRTHRELKAELLTRARRINRINDVIYYAGKAHRRPRVVSDATMQRITQLREAITAREGQFHALPRGPIDQQALSRLVQLRLLTDKDADLIFDYQYLLTADDVAFMRINETSAKYKAEINQMRGDMFAFWQGSTIDNIALLGEDYIRQMRASLSPLVYAISILGMLKEKVNDAGFYYGLDENVHYYVDTEDNGVVEDSMRVHEVSHRYNGKTYTAEVESPDFERLSGIRDCRMDGDCHRDDRLYIAFDYNSRINWVSVGQCRKDPSNKNADTLYTIKSMYVKLPDRIEQLMEQFNAYYAPQRRVNPHITYFYDSTAKQGKNDAIGHNEDYKDIVIRCLRRAGWRVVAIDMGRPMSHKTKYDVINNALTGHAYPAVRFNQEQNEDLLVGMEHAEVEQRYDGWHKSKAGEKLPYNPDLDADGGGGSEFNGKLSNIREEHRTDGSDSWDTLYIGCKYFRYGGGQVFAIS